MYAEIRRYEVGRDVALEVARRSYAELREQLSARAGFIAYEIVIADDSFASITVFDTWVSAEESNLVAANWIRANVTGRNVAQPQVTAGEIFTLDGVGHRPFERPRGPKLDDPRDDTPPLRRFFERLRGSDVTRGFPPDDEN